MFFVKSVKIGNIVKSAFHGDFRNVFISFPKKLTRMVDPHPCDIIAETDISEDRLPDVLPDNLFSPVSCAGTL